MTSDLPNLSTSWDMPDEDREYALLQQASLPSDLVNPADAVGDEEWQKAVDADVLGMGEDALAGFQYRWDWETTPGQRASMIADVALRREMASFIDEASTFAAKPPVDPQEFAAKILERRAERARRF